MIEFRDNMTGAIVCVPESSAALYETSGYTRVVAPEAEKAEPTATAKKTRTDKKAADSGV